MKGETRFIVLQASVVFNNQRSLFDDAFDDTKEGRNHAFKEAINTLRDKKIVKVNTNHTTNYILIYKMCINDDIHYCQLAKKTQVDQFNLKDYEIEKNRIDSYPPSDVFINTKLQQISVSLNMNSISEDSIEFYVEKLINCLIKDFSIFIRAIKDKKDFWNIVNCDNEIREVTFDLVVPNFFNATGDANALVSSAKSNMNADTVSLSLKNKNGKLNANMDAIDSYVRYSSKAGSWRLKIKQKGENRFRIIKSSDYNIKRSIETELLDLVKKCDENLKVDYSSYLGLIERLQEVFYEE